MLETIIIIIGIALIGIMEIYNYWEMKEIKERYLKITIRFKELDNLLGITWYDALKEYCSYAYRRKYVNKEEEKRMNDTFSALLDYLNIQPVVVDLKPESNRIKFIKKKK